MDPDLLELAAGVFAIGVHYSVQAPSEDSEIAARNSAGHASMCTYTTPAEIGRGLKNHDCNATES